jgi:hypothetical protein
MLPVHKEEEVDKSLLNKLLRGGDIAETLLAKSSTIYCRDVVW